MKRVLVLGAFGFIGSALCERLTAEGCSVHGIDLRGPSPKPRPDCRFFSVQDLRKTPLMLEPYDEVYQLAADVGGVAYLSGGHDADVMANNVAINRNVAQWAVGRCGVLVFASSACVYPASASDPAGWVMDPPWPEEDGGYREFVPANDYGWEKLFSERLYQAHARDHGLNVRIARLGNVYGPGEPLDKPRAHLVGDLCRKSVGPSPLEVWGDGHQVRSMTYIDDAVDGLIMLARTAEDPGPVNVAGRPACVAEIATHFAQLCGRPIAYVPGPTGPLSSVLDTTKASLLGWTAKTPLYDGLRATYEWSRAA